MNEEQKKLNELAFLRACIKTLDARIERARLKYVEEAADLLKRKQLIARRLAELTERTDDIRQKEI